MADQRLSVVVGATGLIGGHVCELLKGGQSPFRAVVRSPHKDISIPSLIVDFEQDVSLREALRGDTLFFCFGTTMKRAGSRQRFVDQEWGIGSKILRLAKESGIQTVVMVSSQGASAKSPLIYPRVKGQLEELAMSLGFSSLSILRPSLLLGNRQEDRFLEGLATKALGPLVPWMRGPLLRVRPIQARLVAQRMIELSDARLSGCHIYENDQLHHGFERR